MSVITDNKEIEVLREGGRRLAHILRVLKGEVRPGIRTDTLNSLAEQLIQEFGDKPSFLGYHPRFASRAYPSAICISVNDEVVHGIPNENPIELQEGDIIGLDLGVTHKGLITDSAITVPVGKVDKKIHKLLETTRESLNAGIKAACVGNHIGDIGNAIEGCAHKGGFNVVEVLCGHGVGRNVHEDPEIPNFGKKGAGEKIVPGLVIALEPMLNEGTKNVILDDDGYTIRTEDGKLSAHFEHTILVTPGGPEVLTKE